MARGRKKGDETSNTSTKPRERESTKKWRESVDKILSDGAWHSVTAIINKVWTHVPLHCAARRRKFHLAYSKKVRGKTPTSRRRKSALQLSGDDVDIGLLRYTGARQ